MKIKNIKLLLKALYYKGVRDGIDMTRRDHDQFMGNDEARKKHEEQMLIDSYILLKTLIK